MEKDNNSRLLRLIFELGLDFSEISASSILRGGGFEDPKILQLTKRLGYLADKSQLMGYAEAQIKFISDFNIGGYTPRVLRNAEKFSLLRQWQILQLSSALDAAQSESKQGPYHFPEVSGLLQFIENTYYNYSLKLVEELENALEEGLVRDRYFRDLSRYGAITEVLSRYLKLESGGEIENIFEECMEEINETEYSRGRFFGQELIAVFALGGE